MEIQEHFIDNFLKIKNANAIANRWDDYETVRHEKEKKNKKSYNFEDRRPKMHEDGNSKPQFLAQNDILKKSLWTA